MEQNENCKYLGLVEDILDLEQLRGQLTLDPVLSVASSSPSHVIGADMTKA